jgi:hypothetical protein
MNYLIADRTQNTNKMFIGFEGENCSLEENAMIFADRSTAEQKISREGWEAWAVVLETEYPASM